MVADAFDKVSTKSFWGIWNESEGSTRILDLLIANPGPEQTGQDQEHRRRRPRDIPPHLSDILAAKPRMVWMQLGICQNEVPDALARAGIQVVQDRCLMVDHRRLRR